MEIHGIITGDIVGSRKVDPATREKLLHDLEAFLAQLQKTWINSYETYRGDSLQCAARSPHLSLRIAVMIRAYLRSYVPLPTEQKPREKEQGSKGYFSTDYDIRLGIGLGKVEFMRENKITGSDGDAFRFSGEALEELMPTGQRMALRSFDKTFDEQMEPAIALLDALIQKWTQNQAELVLYKLQDKKEEEIATLLEISQSAVNQRTRTAQWHAVEKLVIHFEKTVESWNR
jgi:hypothetical protein